MPVNRGSYATRDSERWLKEPAKHAHRTPFERDRARIVHSSALRRLGAKTQVLGPGTDDFVRTRLTHSLEVAQVGRELGKSLGCDPDIVDAACLSHDLGHPPFGHNGEGALDLAAMSIGGFEGNAQTLRLLTRLEAKAFTPEGAGVGLNLTRACLDAATKYPWATGEGPVAAGGTVTSKFGVYADDLPVFEWFRAGAPAGRRCLEAQVMDLADDISYSVHDVEDGIVGDRIEPDALWHEDMIASVIEHIYDWYEPDLTEQDLLDAMDRLRGLSLWKRDFNGSRRDLAALKDLTSNLIGRFCRGTTAATRSAFGDGPLVRFDADLIVPTDIHAEITVLKGMAATFIMAPREVEPVFQAQRTTLVDLVDVLSDKPEELEVQFLGDYREAADDAGRLRALIDQVASLTDESAITLHARLCAAN